MSLYCFAFFFFFTINNYSAGGKKIIKKDKTCVFNNCLHSSIVLSTSEMNFSFNNFFSFLKVEIFV